MSKGGSCWGILGFLGDKPFHMTPTRRRKGFMKKEEGAKPNWLFKELNKPDHGNRGNIWHLLLCQNNAMNLQIHVDVLNAVGVSFGSRRIRVALIRYGELRGDVFNGCDFLCSTIGIRSDGIRYFTNDNDMKRRGLSLIKGIRDLLGQTSYRFAVGSSTMMIPARFGAEAIFSHIKDSIANIKEGIRDVVLTVPLHSKPRYREDLIKAAMSQGFNVISILSEPAAIVNEYIHYTGAQDSVNVLGELYYMLTYYMNEDGYECTLVQVNNRQCTIYDSCSGPIAGSFYRAN